MGPKDRVLLEALRAHRIDRRAPVSRHAVARSSMPHEVALPGYNLVLMGRVGGQSTPHPLTIAFELCVARAGWKEIIARPDNR